MSKKHSESFKNSVVEKMLTRAPEVTIEAIAKEYGIALSTVGRWVRETRQQSLGSNSTMSTKERRPQDWSAAEKLQAIMDCAALDEEAANAYCRQHGLYAHHIQQWQQEFIQFKPDRDRHAERGQLKALREENKQLKSELRRKEKALAETAALLVLKKKPRRSGETTRTIEHGGTAPTAVNVDRGSSSSRGT